MPALQNRQITMATRPEGEPRPENFRLVNGEAPQPGWFHGRRTPPSRSSPPDDRDARALAGAGLDEKVVGQPFRPG